MQKDSSYNLEYYIELQRIDIEKYRRELMERERREIGEEEAFQLWTDNGRAKEFHDYFIREHLDNGNEDLKKLIEKEGELLKIERR